MIGFTASGQNVDGAQNSFNCYSVAASSQSRNTMEISKYQNYTRRLRCCFSFILRAFYDILSVPN